MPAPFAALEARLNAVTLAKLANVMATVGGVPDIKGIFDAAYADPLGIAGAVPVLLIASADAAGVVVDSTAIVVGGTTYTAAVAAPDGTGMTRLTLREAS